MLHAVSRHGREEDQVQATESYLSFGFLNHTETNLCPACALAMKDADPEFYNIMWNGEGICWANVSDREMNSGCEISKQALGI
jgi:hypothetical protein